MNRYIAYYKYDCTPKMRARDVEKCNRIFDTDEYLNPMINRVFHECVGNRIWDDVPVELDKKILGWNWKLKNNQKGYVEILSAEPLTEEELNIMTDETHGQICDGYNENPFEFKLDNGNHYSIMFNAHPYRNFEEG